MKQREFVKLYHGDCRKLLKRIKDNSIDLILTDPPYNIAQYSTGNIDLPGRSALNNDLSPLNTYSVTDVTSYITAVYTTMTDATFSLIRIGSIGILRCRFKTTRIC